MRRPQQCATHGTHSRRAPTFSSTLKKVYAIRTNHDGNAIPKRATSRLKRTANSLSHHCVCISYMPPCQYAMRTPARMRLTARWFRGSGLGTCACSGNSSWSANMRSAHRRSPAFDASRKGGAMLAFASASPAAAIRPSGHHAHAVRVRA